MALTTCSECKGRVSDQALMCPHCGFGMNAALGELMHQQQARPPRPEIPQAGCPPLDGIEKRRHRRIDIKTMVRVNGETAMLFNISRSGMLLSSPFTPAAGSVDVTLDNGERVFALKGTIRWVSGRRSFSNLVDFGVEIFDAPPAYCEFVDQLLANF